VRREARLRLECARLYPGVEAGVWEAAGVLADKVLACRLLLPSGGFILRDRALSGDHFEFRGGSAPRQLTPETLSADPRGATTDSALSTSG